MRRISSNLQNTDTQFSLRRQESRVSDTNNSISSQRKNLNLRDDPLAAGHSVRYQSYLARLDRFEKNAKTLNDQFKITEGYMNQSLQVMQRVRELAVTGANASRACHPSGVAPGTRPGPTGSGYSRERRVSPSPSKPCSAIRMARETRSSRRFDITAQSREKASR